MHIYKHYYKILVAFITTLICSVIYFSTSIKCISWLTEPYQLLNAIELKNTPAAPLFTFLAHTYGLIFGFTISSAKILANIIAYLTILLPILYFYHKTKSLVKSLYLLAICSISLTTLPHSFAFGWDVFSNLFLVCSLILFLLFIETKNKHLLLFFSLFLVGSILSRIPNILLILPCVFYFIISNQFKYLIRFLLYSVLISSLIILHIYNSFSDYINYWYEYGIVNGHSLKVLLGSYAYGTLKVAPYIGLFMISIWGMKHHFKIIKCSTKISLAVCLYITLYINALSGWQTTTSNIYSALLITILIYIIYHRNDFNNIVSNQQIIYILSIFVVSISPCIGSDTGLVKMMSIPLIPIALTTYDYSEHKQIFSVVIICLIIFFPIYYFRNLKDTYVTIDLPQIGCVKTTKANATYLNEVFSDIRKIKSDLIIVGSAERYELELLVGKRSAYALHDYNVNLNDKNYIIKTSYQIDQIPIKYVLLVDKKTSVANTQMDSMLYSKGYYLIKNKNCYRIYESNK